MQHKKLIEISTVAAIQASAALSRMINTPVGVDVSPAISVEKNKLLELNEKDEEIIGIESEFSGDINGDVLMILNKKSAFIFLDLLLNKNQGTTKDIGEMEISALTEVANIMIGNFLSPFSYPLQLNSVMHHVPKFKIDTLNNLVEHAMREMQHNNNENLMIKIVINLKHYKLQSYLMFMVGKKQIEHVLEKNRI